MQAFRRGLERNSPLYDELTKYTSKTMDDIQAKAVIQVRLEEDKRGDNDKYYHPSRKITTLRVRDYKPHSRTTREDFHVNSIKERSDLRKDPNLTPTYDSYGFNTTPFAVMREFTKMGEVVKWLPKSNKPKAIMEITGIEPSTVWH